MHDDVALFYPPTTESGFEGFTLPPAVAVIACFIDALRPPPTVLFASLRWRNPPPLPLTTN